MLKLLLPLIASFMLATVSFAQIPTPTPSEADDVVKISTSIIRVDVTVTDRKGKVVRDLRPDEIEIYENGEKQKISGLSFISSVRETDQNVPQTSSPATPLPPSPIKPESVRRTIALVVDDLTLSWESTYFVRRALRKFVDEQMQDGDLVAIIRTGAGIGALQQFTTDKRQLIAAIERVKWNSVGNGGIGAFAPLQPRIDTGAPEEEPEPGERTQEGIEREFNDFRESVFATGTLGAVNYIVRGMSELPGRKSILLLSDGFKMFTEDASGFRDSSRVMESLRRLVYQANRASVVVHTMDARGLVVTGLTAADDTSGRTSEQLEAAMSDRRDQLFDTQAGLQYLAAQTGGTSIVNNNDLVGGIRKILDDQSYYLVSYEPDGDTFDPKTRRFNKLEVKVTRPGTRIRYRSGFFGVAEENIAAAKPANGVQRLYDALVSPFAVNEMSVHLNALFGNDRKSGSFVRSLVHVRASDITLTDEPDGSKKGVFDILAVGFGDNGIPVDQVSKTYTMTMRQDVYERFMKSGLVYDFTFPVKKPGAYQLRVALRDHATGKVGSANQFVEVPNLKKGRLTLSGVALESISFKDFEARNRSQPVEADSNTLSDTALRKFKRGNVLTYGFVVFNARSESGPKPDLTSQVRVFRDGKAIFTGKPLPVSSTATSDPKAFTYMSSLVLGTNMETGDYVLEIAITDNRAKGKHKYASQFVQFEVVE